MKKSLLVLLFVLMSVTAVSCGGKRVDNVRADAPDTLNVTLVDNGDSLVGTWLLPITANDTVPHGLQLKADSTVTSINLPLVACTRWQLNAAEHRIVLTARVKRSVTDTTVAAVHDTCWFRMSGDSLTLASHIPGLNTRTYARKRQ